MKRERGSVAVECALVLPLLAAAMMLVLDVGLLCIRKQRVIYDTFMVLRARVIADDVRLASQIPRGDNPMCTGGDPC